MTADHLANGLGYLGSAFGVLMVVPQIVRVLRHPSRGGVSALSWGITTVSCLAWLSYGLRTSSLPQVPGNTLLVTGAAAVVVLVPGTLSRFQRAARLGGCAAAVLTLAWTLPATLVGYLAFGIGLFSSLPQVYESIGNWRARLISGVSVTTWSLRIISQLSWLGYAVLALDIPVIFSSCVGLTTAMTLVALESAARLRPALRTA